jgi:hypothetical protein
VRPKLLTGLAKCWPAGLVALGVLLATLPQSPQSATATQGSASVSSSAGPFDLLAYEAADWRNTYGRTLELAAFNRLFPESSSFALPRIETGPRSAGSSSTLDPYAPPVLLKAIAWIESGWTMADGSVDYGEIGPPLVSHSGAYGIMQVLSGMENTGNPPTLDQVSIGSHYGFNIARGARILAEKWNYAPTLRPIVGTRTPSLIEDWYYAIWSYHGFSFTNHPFLNPSYSPSRGVYRCDGTQPYNSFPYQELAMGCVANPPVVGGTRLWNPQPVTLPNLAQPAFNLSNWNDCSGGSNCAGMDIPTPNASHTDPTNTGVTRSQVIGSPSLSVSTGKITLVTIPPVIITPASLWISNAGTGPLVWRASTSASWLKVSRAQGVALGTNLGNQPSVVAVWAHPAGLAPGKYTATLSIESLWASRAPATVSVTLYNYPDGTLMQGPGTAIYVMRGGLKRGIRNPVSFEANGFQWGNVNQLPYSVVASIPSGDLLLDALADGNLLTASGRGVYVMEGGLKRLVKNVSVFSQCGYGWDAVQGVSVGRLDAIARGPDLTGPPCPHLVPPSETLVQAPGTAIYVMRGGLKRGIRNPVSFEANGFQWGNVNQLPYSVVASIPSGDLLLDALADGNLLTASGRGVYVMEGGVKRLVKNVSVFSQCGYGWDAVQGVSVSRLDAIGGGADLTGLPCPHLVPPSETLVEAPGSAIYVMRGGLKRGIRNPMSFEANGLQWGNVNQLPYSVVASIPSGEPLLDALADGNLLTASGRGVYVMEGGLKRLVKNVSVFSQCGYGWDAVQGVSVSRLDAIGGGADLTGPPCPHLVPPNDTLVEAPGSAIYVMRGGLKRRIRNTVSFEANGLRWGNVNQLPYSVVASIPSGEPLLDALAEGNLLTASGRGVYVMEGGLKRLVGNVTVFSQCGYGWDAVQGVSVGRLDAIGGGADLTGPPCPRLSPPDGTLLRGTDDPLYAMLAGSKSHIADQGVFAACGYLQANINTIPDSSLVSIPNGPILTEPPCP